MINDVMRACQVFYEVVGCIVLNSLTHELNVDLIKDKVDNVLNHLSSN